MKKNTSGQTIGAELVSASDGSAFTGAVTVYVTGDGGTQAAGSVGSGACTHEGNGFHTYAPAQAETNYNHVAFTFTGSGAVPVTVQVYPSFPQTADAPTAAAVASQVRTELTTELGRIDAAVSTRLASASYTAPPTAAANATQVRTELTTELGRIDAAVSTRLASAGYTAPLDATATQTAAAAALTAYDPPTKAELDSAVAPLATSAALATVDGIVDNVFTAFEIDGAVYRLTTNALEQAPTGGGAADGSGFTSIPWNAAWDAEVQSEVADALAVYDPPTKAEMDSGFAAISVTLSPEDIAAIAAAVDIDEASLTSAVWAYNSRTLTAGTNIVLAKGTGVTGFNDLDAAGIRSAVGLASANIDTQFSNISVTLSAQDIEDIVDGIIEGGGGVTSVSADIVGDSYTWNGNRYRASNIVEVENGFTGALALKPDMNPGVTIITVNSVTITGAATVTATGLTVDRSRTAAQFTVPELTTKGTYTVLVEVTTIDGAEITTTATLKVY